MTWVPGHPIWRTGTDGYFYSPRLSPAHIPIESTTKKNSSLEAIYSNSSRRGSLENTTENCRKHASLSPGEGHADRPWAVMTPFLRRSSSENTQHRQLFPSRWLAHVLSAAFKRVCEHDGVIMIMCAAPLKLNLGAARDLPGSADTLRLATGAGARASRLASRAYPRRVPVCCVLPLSRPVRALALALADDWTRLDDRETLHPAPWTRTRKRGGTDSGCRGVPRATSLPVTHAWMFVSTRLTEQWAKERRCRSERNRDGTGRGSWPPLGRGPTLQDPSTSHSPPAPHAAATQREVSFPSIVSSTPSLYVRVEQRGSKGADQRGPCSLSRRMLALAEECVQGESAGSHAAVITGRGWSGGTRIRWRVQGYT